MLQGLEKGLRHPCMVLRQSQHGAPVAGGSIIPYANWNATAWWDPVTGLGEPNFEKLLALALEL